MKNRNPHKDSILAAGPKIAIGSLSFLVIFLLIFYVAVPMLIKALVLQETRLLEGTETWSKWTDVKVPILIKFYIFNVTNVEEAEYGGKFSVQEVGPYVWEEKRTKQIVSTDEEEDTVTYKEVIHYYFRRDLSIGDQDDTLNIVNAPFICASTLIFKLLYTTLANYVINFFRDMDETFVLRDIKVRELVFDGVELGDTYKILAEFGVVDLPDEFHDGTFAFYNRKNGTPTNDYTVYRGVKDHQKFGQIAKYDNKKEVSWWTDKSAPPGAEQYCNKINGSDGSIITPFVTKDQRVYFFSHEICRSVYLVFEREQEVAGIPAFKFAPDEAIMSTPDKTPDNHCFCTDPGQGLANSCDAGGALRIFSCKKNIPILLSLPHFYDAAKKYLDEVDGMSPNEEKHAMILLIEPTSGAVLKVVKRLQVNIEFQRLPDIEAFSNISAAFVPIFWVEERADLDEKDLSEIRDRLVTPLQILKVLRPAMLGLLSFLLFLGLAMTVYKRKNERSLLPYGDDYN